MIEFLVIFGFVSIWVWSRTRAYKKSIPMSRKADISEFTFDPRLNAWKLAAATGLNPYNDAFLNDPVADVLERRILELENENALLRELGVAVEQQQPPADGIEPPPFKPEEPRTLAEYEGQPHITVPLQKAIDALPDDRFVIDHKLFTGLPGLGKTLIAKVIGNTLHERAKRLGAPGVRFYWSFAANLNKAEALDAFVRGIQRGGGGVWFIDEIHVLDDKLQTKIYSLMEDGLYPYEGDLNPTKLDNVMVVGATTDYGSLHSALKRRFGEAMLLRRMSKEQLITLLSNRTFPALPDSVLLLVEHTHFSGAPWEALVLRREAEIFARSARRTAITAQDVQDVLDVYEIDRLGLRWEDRQVIKTLFQRPRLRGKDAKFVCYGASESDICSVSGLDPEEYRETVKVRLLSRGLLEIRSGYGQCLTDKAVTEYANLKS